MRLSQNMIAMAAFVGALLLSLLVSYLAALGIESRSAAAVSSALMGDGITWASVEADGLQVRLIGTAPNEAARFRTVNLAGSIVDATRVRDRLDVAPASEIKAPRFSMEMLRNDDGIQLIGLVPASVEDGTGEAAIAAAAGAINPDVAIADMLETAAYPAPEGWQSAVDFGVAALAMLPRAKISVAADRVSVTAISGSEAEKSKLEADLKKLVPGGLAVQIDISAPRPVLTPFTLRFVMDDKGGYFDACSADTDRARNRILAAARTIGSNDKTTCIIGLGVPTPRWAEAVEAGLTAIKAIGTGTITFSDADVTLLATENTPQATFDRAVGELQTALPEVFSLNATLPKAADASNQGPTEFTASMSAEGKVELRGRLTDATLRDAVDAYARASFGSSDVYIATRLDPDLPDGWPLRVLAGLEAMSELESGSLVVRTDTVEVKGVTGSQRAKARIAQILSAKLGQGKTFQVDVTYVESLDPTAALPTPTECRARIEAALSAQKISFTPGSADIAASARGTIDALVTVLDDCPNMRVEIAGYTDSQGSEEGNRALSQSRAEAVLLALQGRRIAVDGFTAVGYGEDFPIADNGSEAGREANRRIEFTFLDASAPLTPGAQTPDASGTAPTEATAPAATDDSPSVAPATATLRPKLRPEN
jgi:OmpA-OmpF porin, OOP family